MGKVSGFARQGILGWDMFTELGMDRYLSISFEIGIYRVSHKLHFTGRIPIFVLSDRWGSPPTISFHLASMVVFSIVLFRLHSRLNSSSSRLHRLSS